MLLHGICEVFGQIEGADAAYAVVNPYSRVAAVVGRPSPDTIHSAIAHLGPDDDLIAFDDNIEHVLSALPGWDASRAVLHLLADNSRLPRLQPIGVGAPMARPFIDPHPIPVPADKPDDSIIIRMVAGDEIAGIEGIDDELREELMRTALVGKLAATFVNDKPVSFCDAASETETLWDIGIETIEPYRQQGYAALAVSYMIDQMGRNRKRPIWGAEESNTPSMRLASKLGFRPVDSLYVVGPE
jgi:hypothetical protein